MSDEPVVLTERQGRVFLITLNRPDQMNAFNKSQADALLAAIDELDSDSGLAVGVLTGAGRGFSAGMDLKAFTAGEDVSALTRFVTNGARKPLIAAIEGFALAGGFETALTCDLLVAATGAKLGIPEVGVGLFAAGGGIYRLPSRLGYGKAIELALTGDPITADDAEPSGLIARLTEKGKAVEVALQLGERIARNAPLAVAASKQLMRASIGLTEAEFFQLQSGPYAEVFTSDDAMEGPRAFAEKRTPDWSGT